ncbi:MAG TPA: F0F1 ATP synthase subunit delta, partial [Patescibacteria group bacterium]
LVNQSYKDDQLDAKTVSLIADHMNRQTLKQYISLLKQGENRKQVIITSPQALSEKDKKTLQELFPKKKIIYILDPEMINGIQVTDNDDQYEVNLNQTFHAIIDHLSRYD